MAVKSVGINSSLGLSIPQEQSENPRRLIRSPRQRNTWRVLYTGFADGAWNMAVDEWLLNTATQRPPVLRLYGWRGPTVSLGRHEPWRRVIDLQKLRAHGVRVVRRVTGGRAVFHHREVTYSVTAPLGRYADFDDGFQSTLRRISMALIQGLKSLGVEADLRHRRRAAGPQNGLCFESATRYELVKGGEKLIGSAQYCTHQGLLQHGSIPAYATLGDLWRLGPDTRPGRKGSGDRFWPAVWHEMSLDRLSVALIDGFRGVFGCRTTRMKLEHVDMAAVAALRRARYDNAKWTFRR